MDKNKISEFLGGDKIKTSNETKVAMHQDDFYDDYVEYLNESMDTVDIFYKKISEALKKSRLENDSEIKKAIEESKKHYKSLNSSVNTVFTKIAGKLERD